MSMRIRWHNGLTGYLLVSGNEHCRLDALSRLIEFICNKYAILTSTQLEDLACISLFVAIRDYGAGAGPSVVARAEKVLDSFYLSTPDPTVNSRLQAGLNALRSHLFDQRASPQSVLAVSAYEFCRDRLGP